MLDRSKQDLLQISSDKLLKVIHIIDHRAQLVKPWQLVQGESAIIIILTIKAQNEVEKQIILRKYKEKDITKAKNKLTNEFRLLKILYMARLPVSTPLLLDTDLKILPFPFMLASYIDGATIFRPADISDFVTKIAEILTQIHKIPLITKFSSFLPSVEEIEKDVHGDPSIKSEFNMILDHKKLRQVNAPALLHGDYWPGNILWKEGNVSGIIDWEDAVIGDPLYDISITRFELFWLLGNEAMEEFSSKYKQNNPSVDFSKLAYWDFVTAVRISSKIETWNYVLISKEEMKVKCELFLQQSVDVLKAL